VIFGASVDTNVVPEENLPSKSISCNNIFLKNLLSFEYVPGLTDLGKSTFGGSFRIMGKNLTVKDYHFGLQTHLVPHQQPGHYYEAAFLLKGGKIGRGSKDGRKDGAKRQQHNAHHYN